MRPMPCLFLAAAAGLTLTGCEAIGDIPTADVASAQLRNASGEQLGTARLYEAGGELRMAAAVSGIGQGEHGFHLHTTGRCDAPDFQSAGGHLNPMGREHGTQNPDGSHLGDLPNLRANVAGAATITATVSDDVPGALAAIFDGDGTAVMIHAGPDDYRSDPAGDAGSRVACGVLIRR